MVFIKLHDSATCGDRKKSYE